MMSKGLLYKLLGAFLLVIAIGSLVMSLLISSATKDAFNLYTTKNGLTLATRLAPSLTEYYLENNSWDGVDTFLSSVSLQSYSSAGTENMMMGQGQTQGNNPPGNAPNGPRDMMTALDQRVVLADSTGLVLYDSEDSLTSTRLTDKEIKNGVSIKANDAIVGTVLVSPKSLMGKDTPSGVFLASVKKAVIGSSVIAAIIALIIGATLFVQITAPLRKLTKAANAIAQGDLSQRVNIHTRDEFGELGTSFNSMAESLSKAEVQRQHWMADIAHELRTPLAAIQATLEGIQDDILPMDKEQVDALLAESGLLNRLIGDLRELSLAEAGQIKLECIPTDLGSLISKIVERMKIQADQKGIQISSVSADDLPVISIDPDRITEVINNLIGNSMRYTPQGGSIKISAEPVREAHSILISITDTGTGIDAENLPFVFDRFYRADKSRTRSSGGSGLGLAIVKQLVEAHHGSITVESPAFLNGQQGYGTIFKIILPVQA
jgi:signal transduction histidine kinase